MESPTAPNSPPYVAPQEINKVCVYSERSCQILLIYNHSPSKFLMVNFTVWEIFLRYNPVGNFFDIKYTDSYYLAVPNDSLCMKCLVYGIYFFEFVQTIPIIEAGFRTFVLGLGGLEAWSLESNKSAMVERILPLTAIGELSRIWNAQLVF